MPIAEEATELLPGAWRRWEQAVEALSTATEGHQRCGECGSYSVAGGECRRCGWVDVEHEAPAARVVSARLATPCTSSLGYLHLSSP